MLPCRPLQIMETQSEPFLDISDELAHVREAQTWVQGPPEHLWAAISACKGDLDTAGGLLARQCCAAWVHTALMLLRVGAWLVRTALLGAHSAHTVVGCLSGFASDTQNSCCQLGPHHDVTRPAILETSQRLSLSKWITLGCLCTCCHPCGQLAP